MIVQRVIISVQCTFWLVFSLAKEAGYLTRVSHPICHIWRSNYAYLKLYKLEVYWAFANTKTKAYILTQNYYSVCATKSLISPKICLSTKEKETMLSTADNCLPEKAPSSIEAQPHLLGYEASTHRSTAHLFKVQIS